MTFWLLEKTLQEHNQNLVKVLDRIREAGLKLKPKKCLVARQSVEYLGHVISDQGIQTDLKKVEAVAQYPTPRDLRSLRSFLGLTSYYRRFVVGFLKIANPLYVLTKKNVEFVWMEECDRAFHQLKELLQTSPVLCYPDFS